MKAAALLFIAYVPVAVAAQDPKPKEDPEKAQVEVTGCVKGSTLTETDMLSDGGRSNSPLRRWRLRGPKAVMNQIKESGDKELRIVGTAKNPQSGNMMGGKRIGKTSIYIGGTTGPQTSRDPVPEQPTLDVQSFTATGETCR